jgi:hypothetical protein
MTTTGQQREAAAMGGRLTRRVRAVMGVRTRGLDMQAGFKRDAADKAARAEAEAVIQRWNDQLALSRDMLWSPTMLKFTSMAERETDPIKFERYARRVSRLTSHPHCGP